MADITPGPWEYTKIINRSIGQVTADNGQSVVAESHIKDAQAIAAVPDMIGELERLLDVVSQDDYESIMAVLAKARVNN